MRIALSIAGSDSGAGAGIQADLKTFQHFGVYGLSVITAVTAQNTHGVLAWESVSPNMVRDQIDAVAADLFPSAFKTGMLGTTKVAREVVAGIQRNNLRNYVLDPVLLASSGELLADDDVLRIIREELLPDATLVTPNLAEASLLLGEPVKTVEDAERAAQRLAREFGARATLVTGGHLAGDDVIDVLYTNHVQRFSGKRITSRSTHGTGCTLSAAITALLSTGEALEDSVRIAIEYVRSAISTAPGLGKGAGPLNHSVNRR